MYLIIFVQRLYTTGAVGNACSDLVMIVAKASNIALQEIGNLDQDNETELINNLTAQGLTLTYPCLETDDGDFITETSAIC